MADGDQACIRDPVATASSGGGNITVDVSLSPCEGADEGEGATAPSDAPLPLPAGFDVALSASDSDADGLVTITAVSAVPLSSFSFLLQAPDGSLVALSGTDDPPSGAAPQAGFTVLVSTGPGGGKTRVNAFDPSGQSIGPFAEGTVLVVLQVSASEGVAGACVADASVSSGSVDVEGSPLRVSTDCEDGDAPPTPPPPSSSTPPSEPAPPPPPSPSVVGLPAGVDVALSASDSDTDGLVTITAVSAVSFVAFEFRLQAPDGSLVVLSGTDDPPSGAASGFSVYVSVDQTKVTAFDPSGQSIGPFAEGTVLMVLQVSASGDVAGACVADASVSSGSVDVEGSPLRVSTDCEDGEAPPTPPPPPPSPPFPSESGGSGNLPTGFDVALAASESDVNGLVTVTASSAVPFSAFQFTLLRTEDRSPFDLAGTGDSSTTAVANWMITVGDKVAATDFQSEGIGPVEEGTVLIIVRVSPPESGVDACVSDAFVATADGRALRVHTDCADSGGGAASAEDGDGGGGGLSAGAIFGIVIGSTVGGVLLVALVVFLLSRRSRERRPAAISPSQRNGGVNGASGSSPQPPPGESDFTNKVTNVTNESAAGSPPINRPSRSGKGQFVELV